MLLRREEIFELIYISNSSILSNTIIKVKPRMTQHIVQWVTFHSILLKSGDIKNSLQTNTLEHPSKVHVRDMHNR